jgi:hypothetical protein
VWIEGKSNHLSVFGSALQKFLMPGMYAVEDSD